MLIVIVIIGILAAALIPRLQDVQARARDTKRKADLRTIYTSLEIYFADNSSYPLPLSGVNYNTNQYAYSAVLSNRNAFLSGYITSMPIDPINT